MTEFRVDTAKLQSTANDLNQYVSALHSIRSDLTDEKSVLEGSWSGKDKDTFISQFAQDLEEFRVAINTLRDIVDCMKNAVKEYSNCEENVRDAVDGISI